MRALAVTPRHRTMTEPNDSSPRPDQLVPTLGLFTTVMIVVGGVIGSGIYVDDVEAEFRRGAAVTACSEVQHRQ
mgnify:CR=1 FL=1